MAGSRLARQEQRRAARRAQGDCKTRLLQVSAAATRKPIAPGTDTQYKTALKEHETFLLSMRGHTDIENNVQHAKRLVTFFALGHRGYLDADGAVSATTVNTFWKSFCAARQREGFPKPSKEVNDTVINLISGKSLVDQEKAVGDHQELRLGRTRRVKKHFTQNDHFVVSSQLWQNDSYDFKHERYRLGLHLLLLLHCGTSARSGEFEQHLRWQDFTLSAHLKAAEFRPGLGEKQQPLHTFYELTDEQYYLNAVAFFIAAALADDVIEGHHSWADLCSIQRPGGMQRVKLEWHPSRKHWHLFPQARGETLNHERASTQLAKSALAKLGFRAGFRQSLTLHAVRREVLLKVDNLGHSVDNRMRLAGHTSATTFGQFYQSSHCVIDGLAAFLDLKAHGDEYHELRRGFTFDKIDANGSKLTSTVMQDLNASIPLPDRDSSRDVRFEIYEKRRAFLRQRMDQRHQPTMFQTSSQFMPSRQRLARLLFTQGSLRTEHGHEVMQHLIALCVQSKSSTFCASLNEDQNVCTTCSREKKIKAQWEQHVYTCRRRELRRQGKFTEFCFVCHSWITGKDSWAAHIELELSKLEADCSLSTFRYMTLRPGFCPVCLFDDDLSLTKRFHQFRSSNKWRAHIQSHLTANCILQRRHRACTPPIAFDSLQSYSEHLANAHHADLKPSRSRRGRSTKRSRQSDSEDESMDETASDNQDHWVRHSIESDSESCSSLDPLSVDFGDSTSNSDFEVQPASDIRPRLLSQGDFLKPLGVKRRQIERNPNQIVGSTPNTRKLQVISVNIPRLPRE